MSHNEQSRCSRSPSIRPTSISQRNRRTDETELHACNGDRNPITHLPTCIEPDVHDDTPNQPGEGHAA